MNKRILAIILLFALLISLSACSLNQEVVEEPQVLFQDISPILNDTGDLTITKGDIEYFVPTRSNRVDYLIEKLNEIEYYTTKESIPEEISISLSSVSRDFNISFFEDSPIVLYTLEGKEYTLRANEDIHKVWNLIREVYITSDYVNLKDRYTNNVYVLDMEDPLDVANEFADSIKEFYLNLDPESFNSVSYIEAEVSEAKDISKLKKEEKWSKKKYGYYITLYLVPTFESAVIGSYYTGNDKDIPKGAQVIKYCTTIEYVEDYYICNLIGTSWN